MFPAPSEQNKEEYPLKKNNNRGFTLAELLIVVAIIAVLVAIAIPVFTSQLEKSKESTDAANIRSRYAEAIVKILDDPATAHTIENVTLKQGQDGWQNDDAAAGLAGLAHTGDAATGDMTTTVDLADIDHTAPVTFTYTPGTASDAPTLEIAQ